MSVGNLHAQHGYADALAGDSGLHGTGYAFGKQRQRGIFLVAEVEDVVHLVLGDAKDVTFFQGIDVKEGEVVLVLGYFVAGNLPCDDA